MTANVGTTRDRGAEPAARPPSGLVTLPTAVTARTDPFAHRNRVRIVVLVVLATLNYMIAVALAAVAVTLAMIIWTVFKFELFPDDAGTFRLLGIGVGAILAVAFVVGLCVALVRIPRARRSLEHQVLHETGAVIADTDEHRELRNLLDGLAIAGGIPPPRFAVIDDPAPNSFGIGTRPGTALVGVTTGLSEQLTRDELEAVLAYEVSRIRSWDVALASWTVALTGGAISALDDTDDSGTGLLRSLIGWVPRHFAERLQVWALRDQGRERDCAAVRFTRNPASLIRALEKLDTNPSEITCVSRATAPLWIEFPAGALGRSTSANARRLAQSLLLEERIDALKQL
jgi:heat shock protein HtpX